jgi:hypothetical protein
VYQPVWRSIGFAFKFGLGVCTLLLFENDNTSSMEMQMTSFRKNGLSKK